MSAREKLNVAFFNGSLLVAGLAGLATRSWEAFAGTLAGMLLLHIATGRIRPRRR